MRLVLEALGPARLPAAAAGVAGAGLPAIGTTGTIGAFAETAWPKCNARVEFWHHLFIQALHFNNRRQIEAVRVCAPAWWLAPWTARRGALPHALPSRQPPTGSSAGCHRGGDMRAGRLLLCVPAAH